jgi:hypothetical protein
VRQGFSPSVLYFLIALRSNVNLEKMASMPFECVELWIIIKSSCFRICCQIEFSNFALLDLDLTAKKPGMYEDTGLSIYSKMGSYSDIITPGITHLFSKWCLLHSYAALRFF